MPVIDFSIAIAAPLARVFDLARSIDLHQASQSHHRERAVGGTTSGLIGPGEEVTWRAAHLGLTMRLTSRITAFDPPRHFRDSMVRGPFRGFDHDHFFSEQDGLTAMREVFDYTSPLGPLGRLADRLFLAAYMTRFLTEKADFLKAVAESDAWRDYLAQ